jgi:tetratricopeptide (TPR) repeat protein
MIELMQMFEEEELPLNLSSTSVLSTSKSKQDDKQQVVSYWMDYDLIERDLNIVIELNPTFEFAIYNLGVLKVIRKDYEGALDYFTKAIELNPMFAEAYFNRGLTQIYLKQEKAGTLDLSKAGELGMYKAYNVIKRYGYKKERIEEE